MKTHDDDLAKREYNRKKMAAWRKKNPKKSRASVKKYREANREKVLEINRKWRKKFPQRSRLACKRWCENNPAKVRRNRNSWYRKNREKVSKMRREKYLSKRDEILCAQRTKRFMLKKKLTDQFGGKCVDCGFDNIIALDFHHPNKDKECSVSKLYSTYSWHRLVREASKCVLLCANCHRIRHADIRLLAGRPRR